LLEKHFSELNYFFFFCLEINFQLAAHARGENCFRGRFAAVLPDGIILNQKIPIWVNFGWSCNERCWYLYGHFVYFTAKWYILLSFMLVHFVVIWYIFPRFGLLYREKSGNHGSQGGKKCLDLVVTALPENWTIPLI
jgi:hypothetical protein